MFKSRIISSLFLVFVTVLQNTLAQSDTSSAHCTDSRFSQYSNSEGEDPCTVAIKVGQICDASFSIPAIGPGQVYGPNNTDIEKNACKCSTVYFSLLTVCSACQGADTVVWQNISAQCPAVYNAIIPFPLPPTLAVPHWAYLNLLTNGSVNVAAIQADHNSDIGPSPSAAGTSTPASPATSSTPATPFNSATVTSSSHSLNTKMIIGGVVGPVAFLALLALGLWWYLSASRRKKSDNEGVSEANSSVPVVKMIEPFTTLAPHDTAGSSKGRLSAQSSIQEIRNPEQGSSTVLRIPSPSPSHRDGLQSNPSSLQRMLSSGAVSMPPTATVVQQPTMTHQVQDEESRPLSMRPNSTGQGTETLVLELQTRVEMLTNELTHMSRYMEPPAYDNATGEAGMHNGRHLGSEN